MKRWSTGNLLIVFILVALWCMASGEIGVPTWAYWLGIVVLAVITGFTNPVRVRR